MGALFGLLGSCCIGFSDFFGRRAMLRCHVLCAMVVIQGAAAVCSAAIAVAVPGEWGATDFARGLVSGIGMGVGLAGYFTALNRCGSAVSAPVVATLSAVIPFVYAIWGGHDPATLALIGAAVAFGGLVLVTAGGTRGPNVLVGTAWATLSGCGYGVGLSVLVDVSESAGAWPGLGQRLSSVALMAAVVSARRLPLFPPGDVVPAALLTGLGSAGVTLCYIVGIWFDPPSTVVGASMFPVLSVMVGRLVYHDPLSVRQGIGIAAAVVGVAAVAAAS